MADTRVTRVPAVASLDRWLSVADLTADRPVHEQFLIPDDQRHTLGTHPSSMPWNLRRPARVAT